MIRNIKPHIPYLALLILLTTLIYIGSTWSPPLLDDADAGHAQAAREIVERNDWVTLHINGIRYLEKAPLMYWAVALSYKIFGVNEFATRLPLALGMLFLVLSVYAFGNWMGGERAGLYSGLATSVGLGFYLFTRILIPEVILSFFITISFYFFLKAYFSELDSKWYYAFYAGMAGAVLTKGLIGIVFPGGVLFVFILLTGGLGRIWQMRPVSGILLFLAIAVPWHALAIWKTDKFFWFYFINEHFLRYLGKRYPVDYDTVPLAAFWLMHLLWIFPFSLFLPIAFRRPLSLFRSQKRQDQLRLFAWIWFFVVVGFFSFSTRQEYYTYPAFPALALLAGTALATGEKEQSKWITAAQALLAGLGVIVAIALGYLLWISRHITPTADISELLTQNPENYKLALGHMSDLTPASFAALRIPAAGAALSLSIGFVAAFIARVKRKTLAASLLTALTIAGFLFFAHKALCIFEPYLSSKSLATVIKSRLSPDDLIVINGEYYGGSSIGFYLPKKVLLLNGRKTGLEFGSYYPDAPQVFIDNAEMKRIWQGDKRIFFFVYDDNYEEVKDVLAGEIFRIASSGGKTVYSNRP
jgi:4-amino-4-deoxy-L-arabinose transferase-like glycosyltransferase